MKGLLLKSLSRFAEAEECLKQAFKLDSEDLELESILQDVMLANRQQPKKAVVPVAESDVEIKNIGDFIGAAGARPLEGKYDYV